MKRNHLRSRSTSQHQMRLKNTLIALCESRSKLVLKQKGCRSRPGARNYDMRIGKIARRRRTHPRPEGKTPLGMVHGHPPHSTNPHTPGSSILEQALIDPKTLVHACQVCRPAFDEGAGADIDPWQDLGIIHAGDRSGHIFLKRQLSSRGKKKIIVQSADRLLPR